MPQNSQICKNGIQCEFPFLALNAYPWFEILMNTHVSVQGGGTIECFTTNATGVRFIRGMDDFMTAERRCLAETFPTDLQMIDIDIFRRSFLQTLQTNGRMPVCTGICRTKLY